ncbi:MAG: HAMP domain-containing histidine kinase, partial [Actinomycetota bacterium]|nr:HAMP domain-containing histidine kinase [Actinomycetota bacterium]
DFAAAARHELRTPLTAMRTDLEVLGMDRLGETERKQVLADLLRTQSRVQDTLTALGQLAAGDLADPAARTELELTELLFRVAEEAMRVSPEVTVVVRDGPPVVVLGWPAGLRLALDNVVRNAIRHGRASRVELGVAATGGGAELTVDDNGAGMPPDECDRVFGRFARGSNAVGSGSGLGLALVAQQAALHGGTARLEASHLGGVRAVIVVQGFSGHAVREATIH